MAAPTKLRPALRYYGGKFRLAPWIISFFPRHGVYVEPFGGAFSVGLAKEPARIQIYNDRSKRICDFFRVLRDPVQRQQLIEAVYLTEFGRDAHAEAWGSSDDPVESARRLVVQSFQSIGAKGSSERNGWRTRTSKAIWSPCSAWNSWPIEISTVAERLKDTIIENRPWQDILWIYDAPEALIYCDPPYLHETRRDQYCNTYEFEMTAAEHEELLLRLNQLRGMVVISGYPSDLYNDLLAGWETATIAARAQCNKPRTEQIWINPAASEARQLRLFGGDE